MPTEKRILLVNLAHLIVAVSAITVVTLVGIFLFNNPYGTTGMNRGTQWIMSGLVVLSFIAVGAAWKKRILILTVCFVLSFVPLGFYLLLTPGIFALIGVAHLGFLLSASLLTMSRR